MDYSTREPVLAVRTIVLKDPEIKVRVSEKAARRRTAPFAGCSLKRFSSVGCVLQVLGEPKQNRRLAAEITLQNPLPEPLQDCCFRIEGANLTGGRVISERFAESGLLFVRVYGHLFYLVPLNWFQLDGELVLELPSPLCRM